MLRGISHYFKIYNQKCKITDTSRDTYRRTLNRSFLSIKTTIKTERIYICKSVLPTCASKKVHVNLFQHVDGEGVDLREESHQEGDWEAVGKACLI